MKLSFILMLLSGIVILSGSCGSSDQLNNLGNIELQDSLSEMPPTDCEDKDPEIDSFNIQSAPSGPEDHDIPPEFKIENGKLTVVFTKWMNGADDRIGYSKISGDTLYMRTFIHDCMAVANVHAKRVYVKFKHFNKIPKYCKVN